jgi:hypothetical protein
MSEEEPNVEEPSTNEPPKQSFFSRMKNSASRGMASAYAASNRTASSMMNQTRKMSASLSDKSGKEQADNLNHAISIAKNIFNEGKIPIAGDNIYTEESIDVDGTPVTLIKPVSPDSGFKYDQTNYQAIRRALKTKAVKPSNSDPAQMVQYHKDKALLDSLVSEHSIMVGGKKTRKARKSRKSKKSRKHKKTHKKKRSHK